MKSINLTDVEAKELIEFYSSKLKDAEAVVSRYKGLLNKLHKEHDVIVSDNQLKLVEDELGNFIADYNTEWTWTKKIDFVLNGARTPLTKRQIVNKLFVYEPVLGETKNARDATARSIGATLSRQATNGYYKIFKEENDKVNRYGFAA